MVDPKDIVTLEAHGSGDMGDVTDPDSSCRFQLDCDRWCLAWLRYGFVGGTTQADLLVRVDHRAVLSGLAHEQPVEVKLTPFDFILYTIDDAGVDGRKGMMRIPDDELRDFVFQRDNRGADVLVLEWTNPNTQEWAIEVGLVDADKLLT